MPCPADNTSIVSPLALYGCGWGCAIKLAAKALSCAVTNPPTSDIAGFVECMVDAAKSSGCLGCVCDWLCDHYSTACAICRATNDPIIQTFEGFKNNSDTSFTITNLTPNTIYVDVYFTVTPCNQLQRPIEPNQILTIPFYATCGNEVKVSAEDGSTACIPFESGKPFPDFTVNQQGSSGCNIQST